MAGSAGRMASSMKDTAYLHALYFGDMMKSAGSWVQSTASSMASGIASGVKFIASHAAQAAAFVAQNIMMAASATAAFIAENAATLGIIAGVAPSSGLSITGTS
jgi:hypothetical protein